MNSSELAAKCVMAGFIPERLEADAAKAFAKAFEAKGEEEVIEKLTSRMVRTPIYSMSALNMVLAGIPNKPREEPKPASPAKSISDEIAEEEKHFQDYERMKSENPDMFRSEWTEPNDPRFDEPQSIFDGPYRGHEEYKANTFISVRREATAEGTSMHEICRRKGLRYEALIY